MWHLLPSLQERVKALFLQVSPHFCLLLPPTIPDRFLLRPPLQSAFCPLLSLLINPSITPLVWSLVPHVSAFTRRRWQWRRVRDITVSWCVWVKCVFPPALNATRSSSGLFPKAKPSILKWKATQQLAAVFSALWSSQRRAVFDFYPVFPLRDSGNIVSVHCRGRPPFYRVRVQWRHKMAIQQCRLMEELSPRGHPHCRSNVDQCLFWANWLEAVMTHPSFSEIAPLLN